MEKEILLEHLKQILEFSTLINSSLDIEEIKKRAAMAAVRLVNCEAGSLLLYDQEKEELYFDVALGEKADMVKQIRLKKGQGIAGWVAEKREAVIVNDVQKDPRFYKNVDQKSGFITKNMICLPVMIKDKMVGVIQAINKRDSVFNEYDLRLLRALASQIAVAIENARLYEELRETFYAIVFALADTIEKRDPYTGGHTRRVMEYSTEIAKEIGLNKNELENLRLAAILHDIGKIGIRDEILLKKDKLTNEEYTIIKNHAIYGSSILQHLKQLKDIIPGVRHHHENFNGTGYPDQLKGEEIPLIARIISVADNFDALTTDRPYRKALSTDEAVAQIEQKSGTQFDPKIVDAFKRVLGRIIKK
ncbi:MAG: HD domain-containing protein [Thermodesulfovibrio sp.]|nr:HD domain-containing protein [Thermodesulfovibrio sp.]